MPDEIKNDPKHPEHDARRARDTDHRHRGYYDRLQVPFRAANAYGRPFGESGAPKETHPGPRPEALSRADDQILEEARRRLATVAAEIGARDIEVDCEGGIIRLTGNVDCRRTRRSVERCAKSVDGVKGVINERRIG